MGTDDPRLNTAGIIDFRLGRMIAAWKKADPPPMRVKPVPIQVLRRLAYLAQHSPPSSLLRATVDMIIIAFFFLLRPGEYTDSPSDTKPFTLGDVQLFLGDRRLDLRTSSADELRCARFGSLTFTEQKNGVRGEVIGLGCSGDSYLCPVKALVRRVLCLRAAGASSPTPLARLINQPTSVTPSQITSLLRQAVCELGTDLGFLPSDVSARCLRAAGATALLVGKVDTDVIRLIGRWRSDEMLRYLHVQAAPLMSDFARRMLHAGDYSLIPNQHVPQR